MVDQAKLQEIFADKAYMESIMKLSAEDAAKSLNQKGVKVTADDLMKIRDFILAHQEELQNGELSEESLAEVAGGMSTAGGVLIGVSITLGVLAVIAAAPYFAALGAALLSW